MDTDRFSQGLPDSQCTAVKATCCACGGEIYAGETVYKVNGNILHHYSECIELYVSPETMTVEEAIRE